MTFKIAKIYIQEARRSRSAHPASFDVMALFKFYPLWLKSVEGNRNALDDGSPWINYYALDFLNNLLAKRMSVFEYGSGGSTLYFAERAKEVISVEHDRIWAEKVLEKIKNRSYRNSRLILAEPMKNQSMIGRNPADINSYVSSGFEGYSFENYVKSIDQYPDEHFDIVVIDGRARPSCYKHAVPKVKRNGFVMLDNAERGWYADIHRDLDRPGWVKTDYYGPGPYCRYFWRTSFWQKAHGTQE